MLCHIVVLPEDSPDAIRIWSGRCTEFPGTDLPEVLSWLAVERVKQATKGNNNRWRVFVCPYGDALARPDPNTLRELVIRIHEVAWGARIYIGVSNLIADEVFQQRRAGIQALLGAAALERCRDLFRLDFNLSGDRIPIASELDESTRGAEEDRVGRQFLMDTLRQHELSWACLVASENVLAAELLSSRRRRLESADTGEHLVIVPPPPLPAVKAPARFVRAVLERYRSRPHLVATVGQVEPTEELSQLCGEEGLLGPFRFRHELELWYYLIRLTIAADENPAAIATGFHLVRPATSPSFTTSSMGLPALLFSSSFHLNEKGHCLEAARDVAVVLGKLPAEVQYHVEPAVTLERLRSLLEGSHSPKFSAWIHMGHGSGIEGLTEAGGAKRRPEEWLACFSGAELPLEFVAFLTCDSDGAARVFAEAGVGLAMGYRGRVSTARAREVAKWIARQVAEHGFRRRALLQGFQSGARHFLAGREIGVEPVAYASMRA